MAYVLSLFFIHFVAAFINILLFTRVFLFFRSTLSQELLMLGQAMSLFITNDMGFAHNPNLCNDSYRIS